MPWASAFPSFWEILQAALPLAPGLEVVDEPWHREGNLTARQWLWMGAVAWSPSCFSLSWSVPSSPKLTHMGLGYKVPGTVHVIFSFGQLVVDILTCRAGGGVMHPQGASAGFLLPELCW